MFSPLLLPASGAAEAELREVGVARVEVTPEFPIRLSGYLVRKTEANGAAQRLYAKALAVGSDAEGPAVLITVDATGIPAALRDELARRLQTRCKIQPDRVTVCVTHTHTAPCLKDYLPTLFGEPIPAAHQARIERYTAQFTDALERVALAALDDRQPGRLTHGRTSAAFAANRRTPGGPVDHDLPVLVATGPGGRLRAVLASYACHCTTLGGEFNRACGDWAGYAQEFIERDHPGATALIAIGCAGDANPAPRTGLDFAKQHGQSLAGAVRARLQEPLQPINGRLTCRRKRMELHFDTLPTRAEWEAKAREQSPAGYHARVNLAKLDRGETLPTGLDYAVQSWVFGDSLAMVFLPGEVVVDYSLRLKREFDARRLAVVAYANGVPCYIPSERILKEGGYEGGGAMIYYDLPTKFAPGLEDRILAAVQEIVPAALAEAKP